MPQFRQGDVFAAIKDERAGLAIVFGHIGCNEMRKHWTAFAKGIPALSRVRDPFVELTDRPQQLSEHQWLWFIPEGENHGMTDERLTSALDRALRWASERGIRSIVTNGVANTDHGHDTASNRRSDDLRAQFLAEYAARMEEGLGLAIELISLNDIFVR